MTQEMKDLKTMRFCIWMGPVGMVVFLVGFVALLRFFPPPHASDSAETIAQIFRDNANGIRSGAIFIMWGQAFLTPWYVVLTTLVKDVEGRRPALFYTQVVSISVCAFVTYMFAMIWAAAAFRPEELSPDVIRMLNDLAFVFVLFPVPPFAVYFIALAVAIFRDQRTEPSFPRWVAFLTVWTGILSLPGMMILYFKTGPFAFHGAFGFYIPMSIFPIWVFAATREGLKTIRRLETKATLVA